jgi:hypothetical protein
MSAEDVPPDPDASRAEPTKTARLRAAAAAPSRRILSIYSGEHGVYGLVLVTALVAVGWQDDTDFEVLLFVLGTVLVYWLAHIYAAVVASRRSRPVPRLHEATIEGARKASPMLVAMLIPALLLSLAAVGWVEEYTAYFLALGSGIVLLGVIGYVDATVNKSTWPWRIAGVLATTLLGAIVIGLSILAH